MATVVDQAFPPVLTTSTIKGKKNLRKPKKGKYRFSSLNAADASFECQVKTKQLKKVKKKRKKAKRAGDKKAAKKLKKYKKRLKKMKKWRTCASPYKIKSKKLPTGKYKLKVRATLADQTDPSPSKKKVKIKPKKR